MGKAITLMLVSPLGAALLALALAAVLRLLGWPRLAWAAAVAAVAWLAAFSLPVVSHGLCRAVEGPYAESVPVEQLPAAPALVVLGGGIVPPKQDYPYARLEDAADRAWHAARLYRAGRAPLVVLSGGSDPAAGPGGAEAQAMHNFLADLGVPAQAMLREDRSLTTAQNAAFTAQLLRERGITRVLLVTSAVHMPRARALFEAAGLEVIPAPADPCVPPMQDWRGFVPAADALAQSARVLKEWVGRLAARAG